MAGETTGVGDAGTDPRGVSHWADPKVAASLTAALVLLAAFVVIESRSRHALMPLRIFASRSRSGAYVTMLLIATAMSGFFFFLTIFVQDVLGYSALKASMAFLPFPGTLVVISGLVGQLVARAGARPLMITGTAATSGGMYWFSRIGVHTAYASGLLGPSLVTAAGLGLLFVPLSLVALTRVRDQDSGVASSLLNTGQQVGGAIGLAALGTVAWRAVADSARSQIAAAAAAAVRSRPVPCRHPGAGVGLPPCPRGGDHPRVAGRLGDRAGRPGHHGRHHPDPARGPHQPGCGRPGASGQRAARLYPRTHPGTRRRMR